jgi:hypothetical protein
MVQREMVMERWCKGKNGAKVERLACNIQTNLPIIHKFSAA